MQQVLCPDCGKGNKWRKTIERIIVETDYGWNIDLQNYEAVYEDVGNYGEETERFICGNCLMDAPEDLTEKITDLIN